MCFHLPFSKGRRRCHLQRHSLRLLASNCKACSFSCLSVTQTPLPSKGRGGILEQPPKSANHSEVFVCIKISGNWLPGFHESELFLLPSDCAEWFCYPGWKELLADIWEKRDRRHLHFVLLSSQWTSGFLGDGHAQNTFDAHLSDVCAEQPIMSTEMPKVELQFFTLINI